MGGKIECYLDIASYYSYIAFVQLQRNRELLAQHGVEIELHPFLIGAVNAGSGNSPPWKVPAKAKHSQHEMQRAATAQGLHPISVPGDLMALGRTITPMRALTYIKQTHPTPIYEQVFAHLFHAFWVVHKIPNTPDVLTEVLSEIPLSSSTTTTTKQQPLFTPDQVAQIVAATSHPEVKNALKDRVDEALRRGAFGAPWIWATDAQGRSEPFFGSDRWHFVYEFLGLPYQPMELLPPRKDAKL